MCTSSVAPSCVLMSLLWFTCVCCWFQPNCSSTYVRMYEVVVVGVDWKDICVCVHAWGSTVSPLPALCLPQHPTLPAVPRHQPAPPWEASLHCRRQETLMVRVCIFSNLTLLRCDVGSAAICINPKCESCVSHLSCSMLKCVHVLVHVHHL